MGGYTRMPCDRSHSGRFMSLVDPLPTFGIQIFSSDEPHFNARLPRPTGQVPPPRSGASFESSHRLPWRSAALGETRGLKFDEARVEVVAGRARPAYGIPHAATIEAIKLAGKLKAIPLDPVYTGKGLAGL